MSFDPKDAKVRERGTQTLNRTLSVDAFLTANFHSDKPPTTQQIKFLHDALQIAKRAIDKAITVIEGLQSATTNKVEMAAGVYEALVYHYHLQDLADRKDWTLWKGDLETILGVFKADRQHLFGFPVVVGDTHRLVLRPRFANVKNAELQKKITSDGTASEGFVNLKKSAWKAIDEAPELFDKWVGGAHKFPPTEWGNIKVDFTKLGSVTRLQIAGTLIHETTHKMKNAVDHCYASDKASYKTLTKAQALDNADSHAFAAICLYKGTFIKNDAKLDELGSAKTIDAES